ncbi:MAG TPA: serine/threonine-protein kinase [Pseudomonadota bacterium]|nr:serine/threonine-protein kinase [Pseudomonadota bacterium]HNF98696.1 serine/threonine-protein kinase [Pseudomonadota bacterium]
MARRKLTNIGNYRLVREIGRGGMGTVYEAEHERVKNRVAIKVLHPEYCKDPQIVARFRQEPMAANLTRHAGITHVFESDVLPDGTPYLVMEFLDGQSLRMRLRKARGGLPQLQVIRFARQLADALGAAHSKKIIHRDIKPENIMLVRDDAVPGGERAKVLDFGIAVVAEDASLSMSSSSNTQIKTSPFASLLGTAIYMAPEQCLESGRAVVDEKTDVYGLGIVIYESLCGQAPFVAPEMVSVMHKHISEPPPALSLLRADVRPELESLVMRMLAKSGSERPSMREVSAQLQSIELSEADPSVGLSVPPPPSSMGSRLWLGLVLLFVLAGAGTLFFFGRASSGTVTWRIDSSPSGAELVNAAGEVIGKTPYRHGPKRDVGKLAVMLRLPGYFPETVTLDYEHDSKQLVQLRKKPPQ